MKTVLLLCAFAGCAGGLIDDGGTGTGSGTGAGGGTGTGGGTGAGGGGQAATCPLSDTTADTGALPAFKAQMCNVPDSMGATHWYLVSALLPGTTGDYVQLELYDNYGPFVGGTVRTGTFSVDSDPASCGVCLLALGDRGTAGAKSYFATSGTVGIDAFDGDGATVTVSLTGVTLVEVDDMQRPVTGGCSALVTAATISGTITRADDGGDDAGGCPTGVGE